MQFKLSTLFLPAFIMIAIPSYGQYNFTTPLAFQGFETNTGDWADYTGTPGGSMARVPSGGGVLHVPAADGNFYAELTNDPDTYLPGFGFGNYSYFGFPFEPPYTGDYSQSIKMYIFANWPLAGGGPGVWIDMSPGQPPFGVTNNYFGEHNFRLTPTGTTVEVFVDGLPSIATITTSGWYNFQMDYHKGASPTDPVTTIMNIWGPNANLVGTITLVDNTYDPSMPAVAGGTLLSQDLQGPNYVWVTVWADSWPAANTLAIDDARADLDAPPTDSYQVRYFSHLNDGIGSSLINLSNTGAQAADPAPLGFSGGNLCLNLYVFDPNEEELACCSCFVTPNALVSTNVLTGLLGNNLTPEHPDSVTVALLASPATTASSCNASSITGLVSGARAWGTTIHQTGATPNATYATETEFSGATLSQGEFNRLTNSCSFIKANGSGSGICAGCSAGGLGALGQ